MVRFDAHRKLNCGAATNPLAAWLVPSALLIGGLLGVAVMAALLGTSQLGGITEQTSPELPVQGVTLGASAPQFLQREGAASKLPIGQKSFAFGYLEFDWDPNAPGGVPGFGSWPG